VRRRCSCDGEHNAAIAENAEQAQIRQANTNSGYRVRLLLGWVSRSGGESEEVSFGVFVHANGNNSKENRITVLLLAVL